MEKRGQESFGMSFGVIFSIIIIIAIIAVAVFAILKFLEINKCAQTGLFFEDFQNEIDRAWNSNIYEGFFEISVPKNNEFICFGNLTIFSASNSEDKERQEYLKDNNFDYSDNVFLLLKEEEKTTCFLSKQMEHMKVSNNQFFCVENKDARIRLEIDSDESLVTVFEN